MDTTNLDNIRHAYPHIKAITDYKELCDKSRCDAVVIATHASTHYGIIKHSLEQGLDVLAEKPLTLNIDEAEELIQLAEQSNRMLMVAHTFLYNPAIVQIKQYVSEGILGDIYYMRARRTHLGLIRDDVNAVWDLAPHDISMFLYLIGEIPVEVQAIGRKILGSQREDAAFINLSFPSGVIAHIHVSWADSNKERSLDIVGSKARVVFDDLNIQEPVRIFHKGISVDSDEGTSFGEFKYLFRDGDIVSPKISVHEPLKVLCTAFVESITKRKNPLSDGRFGCDVVKVLSAIDKSLKSRD